MRSIPDRASLRAAVFSPQRLRLKAQEESGLVRGYDYASFDGAINIHELMVN